MAQLKAITINVNPTARARSWTLPLSAIQIGGLARLHDGRVPKKKRPINSNRRV